MAKKAAKKKTTAKKKVAARKKTAGRKKAAPRKSQLETLLVASKAKAALKAQGVNVAGDALENLNLVVHHYIDQAVKRAKANGRKTVRNHDFLVG
jgi:histone H3/H4